MTKYQRNEANNLVSMVVARMIDPGVAARGISALVRAASNKARNELITVAAGVPAIVQHADFIV